jgi:hypothetical protein
MDSLVCFLIRPAAGPLESNLLIMNRFSCFVRYQFGEGNSNDGDRDSYLVYQQ